jgi:hypothetical protein
MPVDSSTRQYPTQPAPPPSPPARSGLNPLTLAIAALAAVVAAVVVPHFWSGGTLWATAMTPVIVAVVKEMLERPAQKITEVSLVPRRHHPDDLVVEEVEPDPLSPRPQVEGYKTYGVRQKHFKLAIITGLIAFVIGAAVLTIPELVAGRSVTSGDRGSSVFGGKSRTKKRENTTNTTTVTTTTQAPAQQQTTTTPSDQQQTTTTPQQTTTTPPPAQTAPTPQDTTPAPPASTTPATPPQP